MGFSVSGSATIIFATLLLTFGMWHTAAADSFERVTEASDDRTETDLGTQNTRIDIESAVYDESRGELNVTVTNVGARQLTLAGTDLLVDGRYEADWQGAATVADSGGTDLWLAGETLTITVSRSSAPDRVKVVAGTGVADIETVVVVA